MDTEIRLEEIMAEKTGGRKIPAPLLWLLKRFFRIDYFNVFCRERRTGVDFCNGAIDYLGVRIVVEGLENLPEGGRYTFVSNHPLGGIDGIALAGIIGDIYKDIKIPVNDFLLAIPGIAPLCIPINKVGGQARNIPAIIDGAFESDSQILLFPAGLCSRLIDGEVQDIPWTKTFITRSVRTGRDVVPIHFIGENSRKFYMIARICKFLKFRVNYAMAFLPEEVCRNKGKTFKVIFGKPIPHTCFDNSRTPSQWAQWVREKVYEL